MCEPKHHRGLGFKDMASFNMALLAKQGWRLLSKPNSLLARVLKGKYFYCSSFLQAAQGSRALWGWQSLLWCRDLLKQGIRWHVADGQSIACKSEAWVPNLYPLVPTIKPNHQPDIY